MSLWRLEHSLLEISVKVCSLLNLPQCLKKTEIRMCLYFSFSETLAMLSKFSKRDICGWKLLQHDRVIRSHKVSYSFLLGLKFLNDTLHQTLLHVYERKVCQQTKISRRECWPVEMESDLSILCFHLIMWIIYKRCYTIAHSLNPISRLHSIKLDVE